MSFFQLENHKRWAQGFKLTGALAFSAFFVGFFFGMLIGVADPDGGWAAWRVGLTVGSIMFLVIAVVGSLITSIWASGF